MVGAITTMEHLEKWFRSNNLPYFILAYANGKGENQILKNEGEGAIDNVDEAWELLRDQIEAQTMAGRAMLEVKVFANSKAKYHPIKTNVDMRTPYYGGNYAGVGQLPTTSGVSALDVQKAIQDERTKWELERRVEDLETALSAPSNIIERGLSMLGQYPALAGIVNNLIAGFVSQNNPTLGQQIANTTIAGMPETTESTDPEQVFAQNINEAAKMLNTDPLTLSIKINNFVKANQDLAQSMLSQ